MNELKQIWCELMTQEEVSLLERLLVQMNIAPMYRPAWWVNHAATAWMRENRERKPGEDPMAVVYISVDEDKGVCIDSCYRFCQGYTQVTPAVMHTILTAMLLWGKGEIDKHCLSKEK